MKSSHYARRVMLGGFLIMFSEVGLSFGLWSVFMTPIRESLNVGAAAGNSIASCLSIASVIALAISVVLFKKFSVRKVTFLLGLLTCAGFVVASFASGLGAYRLAAMLVGLGQGAGGTVPVSILINRWYEKNKGVALSIAMIGSGFASLLYGPVLSSIIEKVGLDMAFLIHAALVLAFAFIGYALVRDYPSDLGLLPYGVPEEDREAYEAKLALREQEDKNGGIGEIFLQMRNPKYWLLAISIFILGGTVLAINNQYPSFFMHEGFSREFAAGMVSLYGGSMILGKLAYGKVCDAFGSRVSNLYLTCIWVLSLFMSFLVVKQYAFGAYALVFLLGMGNPFSTMATQQWLNEVFNGENYSQMYASLKLFINLGNAFFVYVMGVVVDASGSYLSGFMLFANLSILAYFLVEFAYRPFRRAQKSKAL